LCVSVTKHFFGDAFEHNSGESLVMQWWFIIEGHRVLSVVNKFGDSARERWLRGNRCEEFSVHQRLLHRLGRDMVDSKKSKATTMADSAGV
jgi:hypothetical protein